MPELPEVEVTRRGLASHLIGATVIAMRSSGKSLRWPIPADLFNHVDRQRIVGLDRRGKYLLIEFDTGWLIVHLGMSGSLRLGDVDRPLGPWEHFDLQTRIADRTQSLRLIDPRRFGAVLWHARSDGPVESHKLLASLGVEPFSPAFDGAWLHQRWRGKRVAVKQALLAGDAVVGVGNIYACEALFRARIRPTTAAGRVSLARCDRLAQAVRETLADAIRAGGSTLRDYVASDGTAGAFQTTSFVYGRAGHACRVCFAEIRAIRQGQRTTFWCATCQR